MAALAKAFFEESQDSHQILEPLNAATFTNFHLKDVHHYPEPHEHPAYREISLTLPSTDEEPMNPFNVNYAKMAGIDLCLATQGIIRSDVYTPTSQCITSIKY
jgi:hypothetical protein